MKYRDMQKTCPPDLKEAFQIKEQNVTRRRAGALDEKELGKILDSLEGVCDKITVRLVKAGRGKF